MRLKILLDDQINQLFSDNPELSTVKKNKLEIDLDTLQTIGANEDILEMADVIRKVFRKSQLLRAKFSCEVFYATVAAEINIPEKIKHLEEELKANPLNLPFEFEYWGAQKL